jgi:hypothetical protein
MMIRRASKSSRRLPQLFLSLATGLLWASGFAASAHASDYQNLPVVKPVMSCDQLAQADLSKVTDAKIAVKTATVVDTPKGQYCRITATVDPSINFHADLPIEHWTQRFLLGSQGRYTDFTDHSQGCLPGLNGEIVVATSGGGGGNGGGGGGGNGGAANIANAAPNPWGTSPQGRINWAYGTNHMITVAMKDLIKAFYGQPQKFSYMMGCSEGGRQSLEEAQRFPEDFDGISAGAPVVYDTSHNVGFWHGWEYHADQRADGSIVMTKEKLAVLHTAVIAHCAAASGVIDGMLQQPTACKFDKSWVQCAAGATDTSNCLTAEEANVAEQLYLGPNDGKGNFFEIGGWALGSEGTWRPSTPGKPASGEALNPNGVHRTYMPPLSAQDTKTIMSQFAFTQEWWDKTMEMAPLMNAANTNLRPFAQHGDKLILWGGAEDTVVQPAIPLSYYEGVQKELGAKMTDSFMSFFILPGVGHCGGGEGPNQVDFLSPLMAWVEMHKAPTLVVAGKAVAAAGGSGPPVGGAGQPAYAKPSQATTYTRPIYPFPYVARYKGSGDVNDAANYEQVKGPLKTPQVFDNQTAKRLLGPNNQKFYHATDDQLVAEAKK